MPDSLFTPEQVAKKKKRIHNPDGSVSTEITKTFGFTIDDGRTIFVNIPTVWNGKRLSDKDAVKMAQKKGIKSFPTFFVLEDAKKAAQERSDAIGMELQKTR